MLGSWLSEIFISTFRRKKIDEYAELKRQVYEKIEMMRIILNCDDCKEAGLMCQKHKEDFQESAKESAKQKMTALETESSLKFQGVM